MKTTRLIAILLALAVATCATPLRAADDAPPPDDTRQAARTPPRLSFADGTVSFWRTGATDWAPAQVNTALAAGDALYTGDGSNLELQVGPRAFVRAGAHTQLGLDNLEPDFVQFKVTTGHVSLDLRSVTAGHTFELDTPNAAFTIERTGYYRVDVDESTTTFITRRGGRSAMTAAGGEATSVASSEQVVIKGADAPTVETYVAPEVDDWDRWNYDRTDHLIDALSTRYVPSGVYGLDALDHYGNWRIVPTYGAVWVPDGVSPSWAPYSTGRWLWDPYYEWTWLDSAPWGWAPYHYGRWVNVDSCWAWAPGPLAGRPVYAPALVAFYGGGFDVHIGVGAPFGWVALSWGEPIVPWWGPVGFVGVPWWGGWGGPRVVNNVVINKTTIVNVDKINVYRNADVPHGVVVVPRDRFSHGPIESARLANVDARHLEPIRGTLSIKPDAASLQPGTGRAVRPPESVLRQPVVSTRAPRDSTAELRAAGLPTAPTLSAPAPRLVRPPERPEATLGSARPPFGASNAPERPRPPLPPRFDERSHRAEVPRQRSAPQSVESRPPPAAPPSRGDAPAHVEPPPARSAPRGEPPPAPAAREAVPSRPERPLPGEPANRLFPGGSQERPHQSSAPAPSGAAPHASSGGAPHAPGASAPHGGGTHSGRSNRQ